LELVERFDGQWRLDLELVIDARIKNAIESVHDTRNNIAHGEDTGIGLANITDYYESIKSVVKRLDSLANP
jgi:hypothetical protein